MIRLCDDCCPACRAAAAEALGENVGRCGFCGHAELPGHTCQCVEQAVAADRVKIEKRARHENRPVEEIEAEFAAMYVRGTVAA